MAGGATTYSIIRFVEAYGLWHERSWAEWFALISGRSTCPLRLMRWRGARPQFTWAVLLMNIGIVFYMMYLQTFSPQRSQT